MDPLANNFAKNEPEISAKEKQPRTLILGRKRSSPGTLARIGLPATKSEFKSKGIKILKLIAICNVFTLIGLGTSILGPTLIDLKIAVGIPMDQESYIIPSSAMGDVIGTIFGGLMTDRWPIDKMSSISLAVTAVAQFSLGWFRDLWLILTCMATIGFTLSILEIAFDVWILNLWTGCGGTLTHVAYFFYGLGTFLAPLLAEPFLLPSSPQEVSKPQKSVPSDQRDNLKIFIPYGILGFYSLVLGVFLVLIGFLEDEGSREEAEMTRVVTDPEEKSNRQYIIVMISFFLLSQAVNGLDVGFGLLLMNFAVVSQASMTKSQGSYLTAAYWATYTFARLFTLIAMRFLSDHSLMWIHLGVAFTAIFTLIVSYPNQIFLWISVITMGIGVSSTAPLALSYLNGYIKITGRITSLFLLADCFGEFVYPTAMDYYIGINPKSFLYITLFLTLSSMIFFYILDFFLKQRQHPQK